jgi:DNA-binding NarL/FixJ family response regulator
MPKVKIVLAEDHTLVAEGLQALLRDCFDLAGVVQDGRALVTSAAELEPDVVVTDVSMPQLNGIDAIRQIRSKQPSVKALVLTMHKDPQVAIDAFRAGASGYMLKVSPVDELITAIREVAMGRVYVTTLLSKDLLTLLMEARSPGRETSTPLTVRQREVLQLIAEGRKMKEVAATLGISPRTAESHKYEIMQVLGLNTTAELVQYAVRTGLAGG